MHACMHIQTIVQDDIHTYILFAYNHIFFLRLFSFLAQAYVYCAVFW